MEYLPDDYKGDSVGSHQQLIGLYATASVSKVTANFEKSLQTLKSDCKIQKVTVKFGRLTLQFKKYH